MYTSHGKEGKEDEETYQYKFTDNNKSLELKSSNYPSFKLTKLN